MHRWLNGRAAAWKRRAMLLLAATVIIAFLATFPVRFQVHGRGILQPSRQRDVFADVAGVVRDVRVEHGDFVQAGDVLAELHNSDLEVTIAELQGKQRAAREQLAAIHRQRHDPRTPHGDHDRLAGEMLRLQEHLASLDEQLALLHAKRERLVIRSPIDGQIVTWNVARQLHERPVTVGQVLMTVADPNSAWELELYLPESDVGHLASPKIAREPPTVEYVAVTEPTREYRGTLRHLDARAQSHDEHGHSVRAVVDVDAQHAPPAPVGTSVTARINCGRRPIGYVWLHRLLGFVYTKILFRVM
jgi:multidrug efflux pump subunit AcrA (membrane-fusion protein)